MTFFQLKCKIGNTNEMGMIVFMGAKQDLCNIFINIFLGKYLIQLSSR